MNHKFINTAQYQNMGISHALAVHQTRVQERGRRSSKKERCELRRCLK